MSYCRSFAYNDQPCSQSQKMSIGIVVESFAKPRCGSKEEADVSITGLEKEASKVEVKHNVHRDSVTMCKNDVQEGSVRVTAGSLAANLVMKDLEHIENQASKPAKSILHGNQSVHTMKSFVSQTLLEPGVAKKTEADGAYGKESRKAIIKETSKIFSCEPKEKVCIQVKDVLQEKMNEMENRSKEDLRMKLREILGTAHSDGMFGNAKTFEKNANEMTMEKILKGDAHFKPRQNSDSIETDSENADMTIKRPVTRSLARRRAPARKRPRNLKPKSCDKEEPERQSSDIFCFGERCAPSPPRAVNCGRAKRSCGIKLGVILCPATNSKNIQPEITGCEKAPPIEDLSLGGGATYAKYGCFDENLEPEAAMQNSNINHSPVVRERSQLPNAETPAPQEKLEDPRSVGGQSPVHHANDLNCQWFKVIKPVLNSPTGSCPLTNEKQHIHGFEEPDGGAVSKAKCLSKSSTASEKDNSESSDDDDANTHFVTPEPSTEDKDAANRLFNPVRGYRTDEISSAKKVYREVEDVYTSPEISLVGKPMLFRSKRHCSHGVDFSDFSPSLHTPRATGNADDVLTECLDESPKDELGRVVSLLVLALKKVKSKMISVTNKKCSEILVSAAEEIHSHLRSVESQIQTDLGKLTSLKASKRKHLETRLQEQQEHLKVMHEKFKKEIYQYLQECKGAMEGLESQHIELQEAIERQKALHRKLLSQTEAAMEAHLIDAQRQMMSVHKLGKQKMQQLKFTIAECLKEGISH